MGPNIPVIIGLVGTVAFLGLALWLWRSAQRPSNPNQTGDTQFIPRDELVGQPTGGPAATEFLDREEVFRAADRARQHGSAPPEHGATIVLDRPEAPAAATEFIPREELMERIGANKRDA